MLTNAGLLQRNEVQLTPYAPAGYTSPFSQSSSLTTNWPVPASNKVWKKQRRRPAKRVVIASVTHRKGSNYNEMAVLYYVTGQAVCPAVLGYYPDSRCMLLASNHTGMGASLKE